LDKTVANYEQSLQLTNNQYASGVASEADVVQAETQLKTAQAQAIDVGVARAQTEHTIALLIGQPASSFALPAAPLTARHRPSLSASRPPSSNVGRTSPPPSAVWRRQTRRSAWPRPPIRRPP